MKKLIFFGLMVLLCSPSTFSADKNNNFSLKGAGLLTCSLYSKERDSKSEVYFLIGGWLEGYVSAYNQFSPDTYDITSFENTELLTKVLANHCENNPSDRIFTVFNSVLTQLHKDRIKAMSDQEIITIGKRKTHLYKETINRIQNKLKQNGFYKGIVDSNFSAATIAALSEYQKSIQFESTGFPDQTTLWRLLRD